MEQLTAENNRLAAENVSLAEKNIQLTNENIMLTEQKTARAQANDFIESLDQKEVFVDDTTNDPNS
jgi:hypothetical protein